MPTARELLEQADALMRRNRKRGKGRLGDVPTLTQALGEDGDGTLVPTVVLQEGAGSDVARIALDGSPEAPDAAVEEDPISLETLADVPVLTDVVVQGSTIAAAFGFEGPDGGAVGATAPSDAGNAFPASAADAAVAATRLTPPAVLEHEPSAVDEAPPPQNVAPVGPPALRDDEFILEIPPEPEAEAQAASEPSPIPPVAAPSEPAPAAGGGEWDALAEEIRMQVLQRLDLFTDTGLRDQLGAHLRPIVERASAQLVETINRELGVLVRGYVAEAIEREIESWRKREGSETTLPKTE